MIRPKIYNNAAHLIRNIQGRLKVGKPEPIWYNVVAKLYPPLTFSIDQNALKKNVKSYKCTPVPPKIEFDSQPISPSGRIPVSDNEFTGPDKLSKAYMDWENSVVNTKLQKLI